MTPVFPTQRRVQPCWDPEVLKVIKSPLLSSDGLCAFTAFLVSEFSEENIAFYFACEDYRSMKSVAKLSAKAQKIYDEFIGSDAPREVRKPPQGSYESESDTIRPQKTNVVPSCSFFQVNIDHETRDITKANMLVPSPSCFDMAQHKIYMLMAKDCYPRFLRSPAYRDLVCQAKPGAKATKQALQEKAAWRRTSPEEEPMKDC